MHIMTIPLLMHRRIQQPRLSFQRRPYRPHALLEVQDESISRVPVEVVSMQTFTAEEAESFVEFYCGGVGDFGFEGNLLVNTPLKQQEQEQGA